MALFIIHINMSVSLRGSILRSILMVRETGLSGARLLRLLQLASPALPVGAYSYSEGL